ncbi:MAG: calcium-binding protein [Pseudomonadota bacterium]
MPEFSYVGTLTRVPPSVVTGITDLDSIPAQGGGIVLYATSRSAGVTSEYTVDITGAPSFSRDTLLPAEISEIELITIDSADYALAVGPGLPDPVLWEIAPSGAFGTVFTVPTAASAAGGFSDVTTSVVGGTTFLYGVGHLDAALYGFQLTAPGAQASPGPAGSASPLPTGVSSVTAVDIGETRLLMTVDAAGTALTAHMVGPDGSLTEAGTTGAADGLGVAGISAVAHATLADGDYLVVAGRSSSSLSVIAVDDSGALTPVDHIIDDLDTRFQFVTALDTAEIDGRIFVAAGGADAGVSLFELLPGGRLQLIETLLDDAERALDGIGALELVVTDGILNLYVGSQTEPGISHFRRDFASVAPPWLGTGADDVVVGDASDQVFWGRAGDDTIDGGAGADVLLDGSGSDLLTGGSGRDTFALSNDERPDTITDFDPDEDVLDLSAWPFLRNPTQMTFVATETGATLTYNGELLVINSSDGAPLTEAGVLIDGVFNVSRFPVGNPSAGTDIAGGPDADALSGGTEDNRLEGFEGNDTLTGGAGDDLLIGGPGADRLDGGIGEDTVSLDDAPTGVVADLAFPGQNTGIAAGDVFISIEHLEGTGFGDNLRGTEAGNRVKAGAGADTIFGRGGDDTLAGDAGDDILLGGSGADRLDGGAGIDRAAYWTADASLRADLKDPEINTGEAAGDLFFEIEDLQGSNYDDDLRGDEGANRLYGGAGADRLFGRGGEDGLFGGAGDDLLIAGGGADLLDGGAGRDRAAYWTAPGPILADLVFPELGTGDAAGDRFVSVEDLQGTNFGDDLRGDEAANTIWGVGGGDLLYGRGGDDTLNGQDGNDILLGGSGADALDGGAGTDRAAYWTAAAGLRADLGFSGVNTGEAAGDIYANIADLQGSNFDDDLRGNDAANRIWGGAGSDTIYGRAGADALFGQGGDDVLLSGAGADALDGGAGTDRAAYWTAGTGLTANLSNPALNTGDAAGDSYAGIEDLQGSNFADTLTGDSGANAVFGGAGDDQIEGGGGDDRLVGGAGADTFVFRAGSVVVADFTSAIDVLAIDGALQSALTPQTALAAATPSGGGTLFSFSGASLFLEDVAPAQIALTDILIL